jgi:hypothetical protein
MHRTSTYRGTHFAETSPRMVVSVIALGKLLLPMVTAGMVRIHLHCRIPDVRSYIQAQRRNTTPEYDSMVEGEGVRRQESTTRATDATEQRAQCCYESVLFMGNL